MNLIPFLIAVNLMWTNVPNEPCEQYYPDCRLGNYLYHGNQNGTLINVADLGDVQTASASATPNENHFFAVSRYKKICSVGPCWELESPLSNTVQVPSPTPPTPSPITISGTLTQCGDGPAPNIVVILIGTNPAIATVTDELGHFEFTNLPAGDYQITPAHDPVPLYTRGIDSVDVIAIHRYFLNFIEFSPCQVAAGDVNEDGFVDTADALAINQFYLGFPSANVGAFKFTPTSYIFLNADTDQEGNFTASILGDVTRPFVNLSQ